MKVFLTVAICVCLVNTVYGFSNGAPPLKAVCQSLLPQHQDATPQTGSAPYKISTSSQEVSGGQEVKISITSTDSSSKIRGFYLQVRDSKSGQPIGTILPNSNINVLSCLSKRNNAATHNNGHQLKDAVEIVWQAPTDFTGEVSVVATVLQDFLTFWSNVKSQPISSKN